MRILLRFQISDVWLYVKSNLRTQNVHAQNGYFTPNQRLMVWHGAGINPTYQYYYVGETIKYVGYIDNYSAGYRYVVYKGVSGNWCYVADRHLRPNYMLGYAR